MNIFPRPDPLEMIDRTVVKLYDWKPIKCELTLNYLEIKRIETGGSFDKDREIAKIREVGVAKSNLSLIAEKFRALGFNCSLKNAGSRVSLILPRGWSVEREQRYTDLFFLIFLDSKKTERVVLNCKTAKHQSHYLVDFIDNNETQHPSLITPKFMINRLLTDLVAEIFGYLNPKELACASLVCKQWNRITKTHLPKAMTLYLVENENVKWKKLLEVCLLQVDLIKYPYMKNCIQKILICREDLSTEPLEVILQKKKEIFIKLMSGVNRINFDRMPKLELPRNLKQKDFEWISFLYRLQGQSPLNWSFFFEEGIKNFLPKTGNFDDKTLLDILTYVNTIPIKRGTVAPLHCFSSLFKDPQEFETQRKMYEIEYELIHNIDPNVDIRGAVLHQLFLKLVDKFPDLAFEIAKSIIDREIKTACLTALVTKTMVVDTGKALEIANEIPLSEERERAMAKIALKISKTDIKRAYSILYDLVDTKENMIAALTKEFLKEDFLKQLEVAFINRNQLMAYVVMATGSDEWQKGLKMSQTISCKYYKAYAQTYLVKYIVKVDSALAKSIADSIPDLVMKTQAQTIVNSHNLNKNVMYLKR